MSKVWFVLLPLLVASQWAGAEIFRCTKGGEVVYQNFQCSIDSIGSQATATAPAAAPAAPVTQQNAATRSNPSGDAAVQAAQRASAEAQYGKMVNGKYEPRVGMTKRQVRRLSWGEPEDIERTESGEGRIEIWTYPDKRKLVFDPNGRLASVQNP